MCEGLLMWKVFKYLSKDFWFTPLVETHFALSSDPASNPTGKPNATSAMAHTQKLQSLDSSYQRAVLHCRSTQNTSC